MADLVIFDCDGVLVDSEVLVIEIEAEMLTALGAALTPADITRHFVGLSDALMAEALRRDWGIELPATFDEERRARVAARFDEALAPIAGIDAVVRGLRVPTCVASSSAPERIAHSLTLTGLIDAFDGHLYSATMVERGKPAPDLFWHAAASLGVDPDACVVIEDSPHGVEAGRAAGMHVIGFTAGGHCPDDQAERLTAAGAHEVVARSESLGDLLDELV
jgi:HAD superfamily hydrolase (TIGR01509 family)